MIYIIYGGENDDDPIFLVDSIYMIRRSQLQFQFCDQKLAFHQNRIKFQPLKHILRQFIRPNCYDLTTKRIIKFQIIAFDDYHDAYNNKIKAAK